MPRLPYYFVFLIVVSLISCDKDSAPGSEALFYGTWVKGPNHGDTLYFYKKNGRNIMSSNQSFNSLLFAPSDREFVYQDGKLAFRLDNELFPVDSFKWKTPGKVFEVQGIQIYLFMSSTMTHFTFTKVD